MNTCLRILAATAVMALISVMALTPGQPVVFWIDKCDHAIAFGALAFVLCTFMHSGRSVLASCAVCAGGIEIAQGAMPWLGREMSFPDFAFGMIGASAMVLAIRWLRNLITAIRPFADAVPDEA